MGLAGTWYGELTGSWTIDGRAANRRRWLRILRPDGSYTIVFRYYRDDHLQVEAIDQGVWGQQGQLYWTACKSSTRGGRPVPCTYRWEYEIHKVDHREMAYTNRATGEYFVVTRVADDYRLP
jgi:hypothetical protein